MMKSFNCMKMLAVVVLSLVSFSWSAEEVVRDFGTSYSLEEEVGLGDFEISSTQKATLMSNSSQLDNFYVNVGASWSKSFVTLALGWRWLLDIDKKENDHKMRLNADLGLGEKFGIFKLSYRARFQSQVKISENEKFLDAQTSRVLKNRIKVSIPFKKVVEQKFVKKLTPYLALEIQNTFVKDESPELTSFVGSLGSKYSWNKLTSTALELEIEREWEGFFPATYTVIGLSQEFKF